MKIEEIYKHFDKIGSCTFATVNGKYPETRIAHFLTFDENGLYFETMNTKPFYKQLKETGTVSVCGLSSNPNVETDEKGNPIFAPGYFIRVSGNVQEFTIEEAKNKSDARFNFFIEDNKRYHTITGFCLNRFHGEIYDFDFEKENRDYKLLRERFSFGNFHLINAGLTISEECIGCGNCFKQCTFNAIEKVGKKYKINGSRCDECGSCFLSCPTHAITHKGV